MATSPHRAAECREVQDQAPSDGNGALQRTQGDRSAMHQNVIDDDDPRRPSVRQPATASIRSTMTSTASPVAPLALVMGGSRGFGLLLAHELGRRGHRLVICARDADELERAAADLSSAGHDVTTETCDVTNREQVDDLVRRVEEAQGPIEVMICVAGIIQVGPLEALTREHFTSAIDTMLWGPINISLAVVPGMRERKRGRIGLITSVGGLVSVPHLLPHFVGNHSAEFAWFSAGASLPFVSIDAARAAAQVVSGILVGRAMVVTTPLARIGWRIDALFPTLTSAVFDLAAQLLPSSSAPAETVEGWQAAQRMSPSGRRVSDAITTLGRRAADRFNEHRS